MRLDDRPGKETYMFNLDEQDTVIFRSPDILYFLNDEPVIYFLQADHSNGIY